MTGRPERFEDRADQLGRYYDVYAFRIGQPEERKVAVLFADIAERKRAEAQREAALEDLRKAHGELEQRVQELETLLEVLPAGVGISYDTGCKDIRVNPTLAKMIAMAPQANVSLSADEEQKEATYRVFDQSGRELATDELPMQAAAQTGAEVRDQVIDILREDGVRLTLLSYAVPLFDAAGERRGAIGAYVDISPLRAAEAEQERLLHQLQERHRQLEFQAEELQALNTSLDQRVRERTAELEAIFASLPDAVYIGNEHGIYRYKCGRAQLSRLRQHRRAARTRSRSWPRRYRPAMPRPASGYGRKMSPSCGRSAARRPLWKCCCATSRPGRT